jgi:N-acetylmuramic acid 6-phosphate etherase
MKLTTEDSNPASIDIDTKSTKEIVEIINHEDQQVAQAVAQQLSDIAKAVDLIVEALGGGGRWFYVGAGTSGRLGILDAVECPPTFGTPPELVQGIIAGGYRACYESVEAAEDDEAQGAEDLRAKGVTGKDIVAGIAASGRTPYTLGALKWARSIGAKTIAITCNAKSEMAETADVAISVVVGPEVLTGSTRLKAGTAQKMVLNMLSTATMIKLGKVYGNLMVHVHMKNEKLVERGNRILMSAAHISHTEAEQALKSADYDLPVALVMLKTGADKARARHALDRTNGHVRRAIEILKRET